MVRQLPSGMIIITVQIHTTTAQFANKLHDSTELIPGNICVSNDVGTDQIKQQFLVLYKL